MQLTRAECVTVNFLKTNVTSSLEVKKTLNATCAATCLEAEKYDGDVASCQVGRPYRRRFRAVK